MQISIYGGLLKSQLCQDPHMLIAVTQCLQHMLWLELNMLFAAAVGAEGLAE